MNLSDAHCHLGNSELSYLNINYPMCICACLQKDGEQLNNLKNKFVKKAFGIFPNSQTDFPTQTISIEEQLEILQTYLKYADALGEAGFDSRFIKKIPIQEQRKLFTEQIKLAKKFELPLIIHCVRKYGELLDTLKKESKNLGKFLIHATNCSPELCVELKKIGGYFSFGIRELANASVARTVNICPTERILIESDLSFSDYTQPYLEKALEKISEIKMMSQHDCLNIINQNYQNFFNK